MQQLHSSARLPGSRVSVRARQWWLTNEIPAAGNAASPAAIVDLAPLTGADAAWRLATPPDHVVPLPRRWHTCGPRRWAANLPTATRAPGDDRLSAAARAHAQSLAYQWVPALALLSGRTRRLLLADAVGMGKTVQAALVLAELHARMAAARSLVVVPAGLIAQWTGELAGRVGLVATVLDAATLAARTAGDADADIAQPGETCVVSLDTLRLPEVAALAARTAWHLVVVDEAHLLAPGTARAAAVERIGGSARQVLLLTATPFSGIEQADRHLLGLARASAGPDRILVVARRGPAADRPGVRTRVTRLRGTNDDTRLHARLDAYVRRAALDAGTAQSAGLVAAGHLAAMLLRRRACSSTRALVRTATRRIRLLAGVAPASTQPMLPLATDDGDEAWLGTPAWRDVDEERAFLQTLADARARLDAPGPKLRWLGRWLRRVREPVLVFTEYVDTLRALRSLVEADRRVVVLYGAQSPAQRALVVDAFRHGDADLLIATDAAAEGLNLHERCRLVVHVDVPWTPRRLAQRNGRLDRIGQARPVRALLLALRGTHDEDVLGRLHARDDAVMRADAAPDDALAIRASVRRERVAMAAVAAATDWCMKPGGPRPCLRGTHRGHTLVRCQVSARRGRSIRARLDASARGVAVVELTTTPLHPMTRAARWAAAVLADEGVRDAGQCADATSWRQCPPVRRFVARACARAARWHRLEAAAGAGRLAAPQPDLFTRPSPAGAAPSLAAAIDAPPPGAISPDQVLLHVARALVLTWPR